MNVLKIYKNITLYSEWFRMIKVIVVFLVFGIVLYFMQIPSLYLIGYILIGVCISIISFKNIKHIGQISTETPTAETLKSQVDAQKKPLEKVSSSESVEAEIYGITARRSLGRSHKWVSFTNGTGIQIENQNTILFTPQRILVLCIPLAGTGQVIADINISEMNLLFNKNKIQELCNQMRAIMTLPEIISSNTENYTINYSDIESVAVRSFWGRGCKIKIKDGETIHIGTGKKADVKVLQDIFQKYAPQALLK